MTNRPDLLENLGRQEAVTRAAKIAELNDRVRTSIDRDVPGQTAIFMGSLAQEFSTVEPLVKRHLIYLNIIASIQNFGPFTADNDPYGEHDFGSFEFSAEGFNEENDRIMWKIDPYDLNKEYGSEDPTDPAVTHRVLTIFYARDY